MAQPLDTLEPEPQLSLSLSFNSKNNNLSWSTFEQLQFERGYCSLGPPAAEKYSPEAVRAQVLGPDGIGAWRLAARFVEISARLGAFAAAALWDRALGRDGGSGLFGGSSSSQAFPSTGDAVADAEAAALFARENPEAAAAAAAVVRARAAQLRRALVDLGPSFIKAGQVLASRPDIVREDYMNELCTLQDDVPPFPDDEAFAIIEAELGKPMGAAFKSISKSPVAAASLGQVYRAVLRDNGADVAVKVQRPGVKPLVLADLVIFRALAGLVTPLALRRLGCNAELIVDEFGEKLLEELDYTLEARNARDFRRNFEGDPTVKIPWVRDDLSGKRVLTMEWIDGMRCTDPAAIVASGIDVDAFIRGGVVSGLRQLLEFGLFHGDPHPGNIFALRDGRIAYVDFGNVAELSARNKQTLVRKEEKRRESFFFEVGFFFCATKKIEGKKKTHPLSPFSLSTANTRSTPSSTPSTRTTTGWPATLSTSGSSPLAPTSLPWSPPWNPSGQTPWGVRCRTSTSAP